MSEHRSLTILGAAAGCTRCQILFRTLVTRIVGFTSRCEVGPYIEGCSKLTTPSFCLHCRPEGKKKKEKKEQKASGFACRSLFCAASLYYIARSRMPGSFLAIDLQETKAAAGAEHGDARGMIGSWLIRPRCRRFGPGKMAVGLRQHGRRLLWSLKYEDGLGSPFFLFFPCSW